MEIARADRHPGSVKRLPLLSLLLSALRAVAAAPLEASAPAPVAAADRAYASVLEAVVEGGLVDYAALEAPAVREALARAVRLYGEVARPAERDARIALALNAYNANVLEHLRKARRARPALTEVTEIEGLFAARTMRVAGETMTLDALEHGWLRPLGDPRIHAALVCGAVSCPSLRREPYDAARVGEQLDDQCRAWINDTTKNRSRGEALSLSAIFDWFKDDFAVEPYGGRLGFVRRYADRDGAIATFLATHPEPALVFEPYDWRFNDTGSKPAAQRPSS